MSETSSVEAASTRLQRALAALEEALERRLDLERGRSTLADQLHAVGVDRARLAAALDQETARGQKLAGVNREVAGRLDQAMTTIRSVLAGDQP